MNNLLDRMCLRRLCLPSYIDINDLRKGTIKSCCSECNMSNHIACIYEGKICEKGSYFQSLELWDKYV